MARLSYGHRHFNEVKSEVEHRFNADWNEIDEDTVKQALGEENCEWIEAIQRPSMKVLAEEWMDGLVEEEVEELKAEAKEQGYDIYLVDEKDGDLDYEELGKFIDEDNNLRNNFEDWWTEQDHGPMWSTLFEAKSRMDSERLEGLVDELYNVGIGLMVPDSQESTLNAMMFINGAGYDFYEAHWIPLYTKVFGWVDVPSVGQIKCPSCGKVLDYLEQVGVVQRKAYIGEDGKSNGKHQEVKQEFKTSKCPECGVPFDELGMENNLIKEEE